MAAGRSAQASAQRLTRGQHVRELLADPLFAEMFRAQARALAGLDDPNTG